MEKANLNAWASFLHPLNKQHAPTYSMSTMSTVFRYLIAIDGNRLKLLISFI